MAGRASNALKEFATIILAVIVIGGFFLWIVNFPHSASNFFKWGFHAVANGLQFITSLLT